MRFEPLLCVTCYLSCQCWPPSWLCHECSELKSLVLTHIFYRFDLASFSKYIVSDFLERIWDDLGNKEDIYGWEDDEGV